MRNGVTILSPHVAIIFAIGSSCSALACWSPTAVPSWWIRWLWWTPLHTWKRVCHLSCHREWRNTCVC